MGEIEAKELYIFIQNDGDLYRQQGLPIIKNLVQKIDRGVYNRDLAVKLYGYLAESGAKKYVKEQGGGGGVWYQMFDKASRELAAKNFVADFEGEYKLGNYDQYHAKKYQKAKGVLNNPAFDEARKVGAGLMVLQAVHKYLVSRKAEMKKYKVSVHPIQGMIGKYRVAVKGATMVHGATAKNLAPLVEHYIMVAKKAGVRRNPQTIRQRAYTALVFLDNLKEKPLHMHVHAENLRQVLSGRFTEKSEVMKAIHETEKLYRTHENPGKKKLIYGVYSKGKFGLTTNKKSALDHVEKHGGQVK